MGAQALAVAEAKGWERWSLRDVAAELGISPNALYRHVGDRDGLVVAMGVAAAEEIHEYLADTPGRGKAAVVRMSVRYVEFAVARPHAYAAFMRAKPPPADPKVLAWSRVWADVRDRVESILPDSTDAAAFALWAFLHGRVELALGPARLADPTSGVEDGVRAMLRGFEASGKVPNPLPEHVAAGVAMLRASGG